MNNFFWGGGGECLKLRKIGNYGLGVVENFENTSEMVHPHNKVPLSSLAH